MKKANKNSDVARVLSSASRRKFLKVAGAAGLSTSLAGCGGSDEDTTTTTDDSGGGDQTTGTGDTSGDISGVNFEYWDVHHSQSTAARESVQSLVEEFESETGSNLRVNYDSVGNSAGSKWINAFQRGDYPNIITGFSHIDGKYMDGGWIKPFSEYKDEFSQETLDGIEWMLPVVEYASRMYDEGIMGIPFGFEPKNPIVARIDHFEEAGLDPEEDFPPKNYEHLIEVATTLQEDGPGKFGFQIWGTASDWLEVSNPMAIALGGKDGAFLNEAADDTNIDNDTWIQNIKNWSEIYTKHGLSSDGTVNANDETAVALMRQGDVSMCQVAPANHPSFMEQARDMMMDGTIQWGPMYSEPSGQRGTFLLATMAITRKPEQTSEEEWAPKERAAIQFIEKLLSKDFQKNLQQNYGYLPVRDDVWEEATAQVEGEDSHHFSESLFTMAEEIDVAWSFHPKQRPAMVSPAPHMQKVLQGDLTPEQACKDAAEEFRKTIN